MFGSATLSLLIVLLMVSIFTHQGPLFLLALALFLAAGLSRIWEKYCLVGVEYRRAFSSRRVQFGETVDLDVEIVNRKILPLAWLQIEDEIPRALPPSRGQVDRSHKAERSLLTGVVALRPYERIRRRHPIDCTVRGEHQFGPVRLRSGDLFGLTSREVSFERIDTLIVYPRVVPLTALGLPAREPLGDLRTQSWIFEDPSRIASVREYRPGDSQRRIHWAASARTQRLQVKVFEPTTSHKLAIFLNVRSTPGGWWGLDYDSDALELTISTAASISAWSLEQGYQVGLVTNGMHRFGQMHVAVDSSGDPAHLPRMLEALARLQPFAVQPFEDLLREQSRRLPYGSTVVVVSAVLKVEVAASLMAMRRRGHPVTLIYTGRGPAVASLDGVVVRSVGPPEVWRDQPAISVAGVERPGR